jgi:hypothetical protein
VLSPELRQAFGGTSVTRRNPAELDLTTHRRTGVLDAIEPLRDDRGRVYGAVETSIPLRPIVADGARIRSRILVFLIAGATLLWLLLLPVTTRAARGIAQGWLPGRRRTRRRFRRALTQGDVELVYAMVGFGQNLGLRVVAEGVEDAATLDFLADLGCHLIQGYHVSRPLEADALDRWLHRELPSDIPRPPSAALLAS